MTQPTKQNGAPDPVVSEPRDRGTDNNRAPHIQGLETSVAPAAKEIRDPSSNPHNSGQA